MGDGVQAPVGERGAALQVERGNAAQRRQRAQPIVYERHVAPPVQAQRPACGVAKSSACLAAGLTDFLTALAAFFAVFFTATSDVSF